MRPGADDCVSSRTVATAADAYVDHVPPQHPITRIEQVARDLGALAREIEDYAGPDARRTLLYWQSELRDAIAQLNATKPTVATE